MNSKDCVILEDTVRVRIWGTNIHHYLSAGYQVQPGDIIAVPVMDLPHQSNVRVRVRCPDCSTERSIRWGGVLRHRTTRCKPCGLRRARMNYRTEAASGPDHKCPRCKVVKLRSEFWPSEATASGLASNCKACDRERHRARYEARKTDPTFLARQAEQRRFHKIRRAYGVDRAAYEDLLASQGGRCGICEGEMSGRGNCHLDHDHVTGRVRGVLCHRCNTAIGLLQDSPENCRAAALYLERTRTALALLEA